MSSERQQKEYIDRAELVTGLREWIANGKVVGEELTAIVVQHEATSSPLDTIRAADIPSDPHSEKVDDLAERIAKKIEGDARGFGTFERYSVERRQGHRTTAYMTFGLEVEKDGRRGRTEKPSEEGLLALGMRLTDKAITKSLDFAEKNLDRGDRRLADAFAREEALRNENMVLRAQIDEMTTAKELREINARAAEEKAKMVRELFKDLKTLVPIIANRMANGELVPLGDLAPEQRLIREAVRQLDGPEMTGFMKLLEATHPRVALMLAELVLTVQGENDRRNGVTEAALAIVKEHGDKEEPAATAAKPLNGSPAPKAIEASHRNGGEIVAR